MRNTVLITGATSGIGYDFAVIFAEKGYDLFLASRNQKKLDEIKSDLEAKHNISVTIMPIDLSKARSARKVFEETRRQKIVIDVLINNAGFGIQGEHVDLEMTNVEAMLQLNITTLTELCTLFGSEMKKKKAGYILNVASTGAFQPTPYFAAYAATKSYVLNFSEAIAKELEDYNVVVTCLSPGTTDTNFFEAAGVGDREKGFWANSARMSSGDVAMFGVNALFSRKLSVVSGLKNSILVFSNRFAPGRWWLILVKK